MVSNEVKQKLTNAQSLEEVKELIKDEPGLNPARVYEEISKRRHADATKLDLEELDAVSGGWDRDWKTDGRAATCEYDSWCGSNDCCLFFDVTYSNFWATCPDGNEHVYDNNQICTRCGYIYRGGSGMFPN